MGINHDMTMNKFFNITVIHELYKWKESIPANKKLI